MEVQAFSVDPSKPLDSGDLGKPEASRPAGQSFVNPDNRFNDGSHVEQLTSQVNPWEQQPGSVQEQKAVAPTPDPTLEEVGRLKKIIGDQGNTIGELRKLMATLTQRLTQATPQGYQQPAATPNLFRNREPNDYPTAAEIQQALLAAGGELYQAINQRLETLATQAQLQATGATPEEASMIQLEFPNLNALSPNERASIIGSIIKARRLEQTASQSVSTQATTQAAASAVRQRVYVEQPQAVTNVPSQPGVINIDQFGKLKNSAEMEKVLTQLGAGRVDDWGRRG